MMPIPDLNAVRTEALSAGAMDPAIFRFCILEFDKDSGELLGMPAEDVGLAEGIRKTARLVESRANSHFCLQPVGFIQ